MPSPQYSSLVLDVLNQTAMIIGSRGMGRAESGQEVVCVHVCGWVGGWGGAGGCKRRAEGRGSAIR